MKKLAVDASIRIDAYGVLCEAVDSGIGYGYRRAHKHNDDPDEHTIKAEIYSAVMNELSYVLKFPGDES